MLKSRHSRTSFSGDASASSFFFCLFFFLHKKAATAACHLWKNPPRTAEWAFAVANRNQRKKRFLQIHGSESETSIPRVKYITEKRKKQKEICIHRKSNAKCPLLSFSLFACNKKRLHKEAFCRRADGKFLSRSAAADIFCVPSAACGETEPASVFPPLPCGTGEERKQATDVRLVYA